jgi:acyl-CoA synthetase (AMP-forming)/AMP-acid ligase II
MTAIMDAPLRALYFRPVEPRHFAHWPAGMPRRLALPPVRLHDLLARAASRHPDKPATVFDGTARTYGEVLARSDALAAHLQRACGVAPRDRVLLDLQNGHDFVVALFGILRADAIEVPLYRRIEPKAQCSSSSASSSRKSFCTATSSSNPGNDFFSEVMRITAYFTAGAAWPE